MKKVIIGIGILASLLLAGCGKEEVKESSPVGKVTELEIEKENGGEKTEAATTLTKVESFELVKEKNGFLLDITVPQIKGLDDFNEEALNLGKDLELDVRETEKEILEIGSGGGIVMHAEGEMGFDVKHIDHQTVSVLVNAYSFAGGAHGSPYKVPLNYDLTTGTPIKLNDIFEETNFLDELSALTRVEIEKSEIKELFFEPFEKLNPDPKFYLTRKSVVLVFDQYEYTAGAAGVPEIAINKTDLKSLKGKFK